jgi:hypothetical protein
VTGPEWNPDAIRREMKGSSSEPQPPARKKSRRSQDRSERRQPLAPERWSMLAQDWYARGEAVGFSFPYDVNYLALALQRTVEADSEIRAFLAKGRHDQVDRWLAKMVERWWEDYTDEAITAKNAKEYFLEIDWDDLRDYARSCLRAKYLLEHGRRVEPPVYPGQTEYQERLRELGRRSRVQREVEHVDADVEPPQVDPDSRARLRSFVTTRRKK